MSAPLTLRPYQLRAVAEVRTAFQRARRVLLVLPTGGGKTALASVLIANAHAKGRRCLFLVHRREIVLDTARRLRAAGVPCGVVMAGEPLTDDPVQVASIQTVVARELAVAADLVVWDEAHHAAAETYKAVAGLYPTAYHLGLTATPERSDRQGLRDAFDEIVVGSTIRELTELGVLAPCDVVGPTRRRDALAMAPFDGWQRWADGRPTVAFVDSIDASQRFVAELSVVGVAAAHLDGATPVRERDAILAAFKAGTIDVLSNVFVLTEGWDEARAEVILLARGTGAVGPYLQMIGRALRIGADRSKRATLIDLCGTVHQHGLPGEDREWTLDGIGRAKQAREWVRQCAVCGSVFEGRKWPATCPDGHPFPPRPLRKVRADDVARIASVTPRSDMQAEFDRLCVVARRRGWKPQAVGMQFKARFGFWPQGFRETRAAS